MSPNFSFNHLLIMEYVYVLLFRYYDLCNRLDCDVVLSFREPILLVENVLESLKEFDV